MRSAQGNKTQGRYTYLYQEVHPQDVVLETIPRRWHLMTFLIFD